ncbi:hypothetical protein RAH32_19845 [Paracoccus sp. WLY502]|uniref:hypothetical protein n=1 Tax=Paracoccus yibinensis TaxID=3068891 RepID=UPI002796452E|nr:hypothetical protein [Paracoccus sp. WLY502]MDQ1902679.1 hypothetical protein [Paracoccus sp. WLY502]
MARPPQAKLQEKLHEASANHRSCHLCHFPQDVLCLKPGSAAQAQLAIIGLRHHHGSSDNARHGLTAMS